ncbi:MAG: hypothetical protein ACK5PP_16310 [Acidimicrobiales bacterium]
MQFGLFSTFFTSFLIGRGILRALVLDPVAMAHTGARANQVRAVGVSVSLGLSLTAAAVGLVAAALLDIVPWTVGLAAGPAAFALLLIDNSRLFDIAAGRPQKAVVTSGVLVATGLGLLALSSVANLNLAGLLTVTALGAVLALSLRRNSVVMPASLPVTRAWLADHRIIVGPLLTDFLANMGVVYSGVYLLAFLDLREAGTLRAAQMVAAPLYMLFVGITQIVMTEGAREPERGPAHVARLARRALLFSVLASALYLLAVFVGRDVIVAGLGATGEASMTAILAMGVLAALTAPAAAVTGLLRALQQPGLIVRARLLTAVPIGLSTLVGAFHGGAAGVILYGIGAQIVSLPVWWWVAKRGMRTASAATEPSPQTRAATSPDQTGDEPMEMAFPPPIRPERNGRVPMDGTATNGAQPNGIPMNGAAMNGAGGGTPWGDEPGWRRDDHPSTYPSTAGPPPTAQPPATAVHPATAARPASTAPPPQPGHRPEPAPVQPVAPTDPNHPQPDGDHMTATTAAGISPSSPGTAPPSPRTSARFVLGAMLRRLWLIIPLILLGAAAAYVLGRSSGAERSVSSVPMALEHVDWSGLEAEHQWNEQWVDTQLPHLVDPGSATVEYREPDSLQLTSFSLAATADADEAAREAVAEAAQLLIAARAERYAGNLEAEAAPIDLRISQAQTNVTDLDAQLAQGRADQQDLEEANASEIEISAVVGDVWALETRRNTWTRELVEAQAERSRIDVRLQDPLATTVQLGEPRTESSTSGGAVVMPLVAGGLIGLWLGAALAYALELTSGRVRDADQPQLRRLGVPVADLGSDKLDPTAALSLYRSLGRGPVTFVDVSPDAGSREIAAAVPEHDAAVAVVDYGGDDRALLGSRAILVAAVPRSPVRNLEAAYRRCQDLGVPVDRVVLTGDGSLDQLHASVRRPVGATAR